VFLLCLGKNVESITIEKSIEEPSQTRDVPSYTWFLYVEPYFDLWKSKNATFSYSDFSVTPVGLGETIDTIRMGLR
jgi:hypothetical protein